MKRILLLLVTTFSLCCCDKDDDKPQNPVSQLPPETQVGANTFGCLINGEPFVVSNTSNQTAIYQDGGLLIGGQKNINNNLTQVSMFISEANIGEIIAVNNSYVLNSNSVPKGEYYIENQNCFYFTSKNYTGSLMITKIDNINFIISGTFEFKSISENCTDIINITNGRFDLQYIP
jgi:predicted small secreted protein